jgi:hypothetical protein
MITNGIPSNIHQLNEYPEWTTPNGIQDVVHYVLQRQLGNNPPVPAGYDHHLFLHKFRDRGFFVQAGGGGNRLFYRPHTIIPNPHGAPIAGPPRIDCEVIAPANRIAAIRNVYNNDREGLGIGVQQFYHQILKHFIGITRDDCNTFLKHQSNFQMTRPWDTKGMNHPLIAKTSNERWEVDLLILSKYSGQHDDPY